VGRRQFGTARCLPSGAWQARYINEVGRRITAPETFATKADALRWLTVLEADVLKGTFLDPRAGQVTFEAWSEDWIASKPDKRANSIARDRAALRTHFNPAFGHRALASITPVHIRGVVSTMRRAGLAPKSVRTYVGTLAAIFNAAVDADLIPRSPVRGFHLETIRRRERPTIPPTTLIELADAVPERFRALILTAGILGLRWSEVIALRVRDIGFLTRTVEVRQTVQEVSGHVSVVPFTKTDASRRTIAIPPILVGALARHLAEFRPGASQEDLVFVGERGGILRRSFLARYLKPAAEAIGLPVGKREGIDFHGLRHIAASFMVSTGEHPKVMQSRLGHATPNLTLGLYAHVSDDVDRAAAGRLEELLTRDDEDDTVTGEGAE
jgi:integrase